MKRLSPFEVGCIAASVLIVCLVASFVFPGDSKDPVVGKAVAVAVTHPAAAQPAETLVETGVSVQSSNPVVEAVAVVAKAEVGNSNVVEQTQQKEVQVSQNVGSVTLMTVADTRPREQELEKKIAAEMARLASKE